MIRLSPFTLYDFVVYFSQIDISFNVIAVEISG